MNKETFSSELHVLKEIAEILNEGSELSNTLACVLEKLVNVTGLDTGWIFFIDKQGKHELVASYSLPPALLNETIKPMCHAECWCVDRYRTGRLNKACNIMECKRLEDSIIHNWGDTNNITHHATVPLQAGGETFGVLNVAAANKIAFTDEELNLLSAVSFQIGTAIKRIQLTERIKEVQVIEERNRLAKDLHDSVNQLLFSIHLTAKAGMKMTDNEKMTQTFSHIQQMITEAQGEMKALIWQLRPKGLEKGIVHALVSYGEMIGLNVHTTVKGIAMLPANIEETLWRVGQEAFNNCKKHADVDDVFFTMNIQPTNVQLSIMDRGRGFERDICRITPTLGLRSMDERIESVNGKFEIHSEMNKGTEINVTIPF